MIFGLERKYILIAGTVLLLLIILGWYFYRQGKKTVSLQYLPGELPGNPGSGNTIGASNDEIKRIANALYGDMKGFNLAGHNYDPYNAAILLSDTDLIKLSNAFNTQYQTASGQTLVQWIGSEKYYYPDVPGSLYNRLKKLNLSN